MSLLQRHSTNDLSFYSFFDSNSKKMEAEKPILFLSMAVKINVIESGKRTDLVELLYGITAFHTLAKLKTAKI